MPNDLRRDQTTRDRAVRLTWAGIDALVWFVAIWAATALRFDFSIGDAYVLGTLGMAVLAALVHTAFGLFVGPYAVGHQRGSFEEVADLGRVTLITMAVLLVIEIVTPGVGVPRSVPLIAGLVALAGMLAARFVLRARTTRQAASADREHRALIFGAGSAGRQLVRSIVEDPKAAYTPVGFVDDAPSKAKLRIDGVRVRGTRRDIKALAEKYDATHLIVALPNAESGLLRTLTELGDEAGLRTMVLPPVASIADGRPQVSDLRDINLADLLGRRPIELDQAAISAELSGKVVLVTGAGGSIGSELARQISKFKPAKLLLLERDESSLQATSMSLVGHGLLDSDDLVLADIRDLQGLHAVFQKHRPEVVFHAAALKHLPLLEAYPHEAWLTNVMGTHNVLTAASAAGVQTFVNVSTDKAANPTSVLGYSKRLAERITSDFAGKEPGRYVSVRFGNVLGSRGSVIPAFTAQIRKGGPVTVTHPDVERYFMLIPEACQLVMQAAAIGHDGEVMVLDMGTPVKIVDVAKRLIAMSGKRDVEITYTGLRPGEKMSEELFKPGDDARVTGHELVSAVDVPLLDRDVVRDLVFDDAESARAYMDREATFDLEVRRTDDTQSNAVLGDGRTHPEQEGAHPARDL
ncbi:polysaccharide biosynthesis protein [Kytococcus schroeteri]|uniref:polysaccharide biosynthesis protein n=1 Tax=Kytococcus schroeteri TaxID=138300 RepID=UPI001141ED5F|nr:nucleoside-diphosphate sugar epimerase/dehydratase [Kytococcus schroeteri]